MITIRKLSNRYFQIPDKEICQLVKHYYTWKKSRMKTSLMDKQAVKRRHDDRYIGGTCSRVPLFCCLIFFSDDSTAEENELPPAMTNNVRFSVYFGTFTFTLFAQSLSTLKASLVMLFMVLNKLIFVRLNFSSHHYNEACFETLKSCCITW